MSDRSGWRASVQALTAEQVREVCEQCGAGKKIAALALDFDVGHGTIQRALAAAPSPVRAVPAVAAS